MNRTKIEWTDYTWNPVTGCWGPGGTAENPNRCPYCAAKKWACRLPYLNPAGYDHLPDSWFDDPFQPTFWPDRLDQPAKVKKPSRIFVCFMGDLFGDSVPWEWIDKIRETIWACPQHTFQFLTKNPKRLKDFNIWPPNCWVGTTVTNQADADERLPWILQVEAPVRFVSHEPLLGAIDVRHVQTDMIEIDALTGDHGVYRPLMGRSNRKVNWAIIGSMTGPGAVKPDPYWVNGLFEQYRAAGIPVFLKDNLYLPEKIQEWPCLIYRDRPNA